MKYIEVHLQTNKVHRVEDALPSNSAEAAKFIECLQEHFPLWPSSLKQGNF